MYKACVITVSDRASAGIYEDKSGPEAANLLTDNGYEVTKKIIIPDDIERIKKALLDHCEQGTQLIITTGGTGFAPRDVTPEATQDVCERNVPGIAEAIRAGSLEITRRAMLSREASVIRNQTLIINLPGSPKAVRESLEFVLPSLRHGLEILLGRAAEPQEIIDMVLYLASDKAAFITGTTLMADGGYTAR